MEGTIPPAGCSGSTASSTGPEQILVLTKHILAQHTWSFLKKKKKQTFFTQLLDLLPAYLLLRALVPCKREIIYLWDRWWLSHSCSQVGCLLIAREQGESYQKAFLNSCRKKSHRSSKAGFLLPQLLALCLQP